MRTISTTTFILILLIIILVINNIHNNIVSAQATVLSDLWRQTISSSSAASYTPPYVSPSGDFLVIGSKSENDVKGLATSNGATLWSSAVAGRVSQSPSVFCTDSSKRETCVAFVGSSSANKMVILNGTDGTLLATKALPRVVNTMPGAVNDSSIPNALISCVGASQDFSIWSDRIALNGSNVVGSFGSLWTKTINQRPTSACIPVNGNTFAIGSITGDFYLLNAASGAQIWKQQLFTQVNTPPIIYDDYTLGQLIIFGTFDGRIVVLQASTGSKLFDTRVSTSTNGIKACAVHPNARMVVVGDDGGTVAAMSLVDGLTKFRASLSSQAIVSLAEIRLTSSMQNLAATRLGVTVDSPVGLIAGAGNQLFFLLYATHLEVKIVFSYSESSASLLSGGISTSVHVPNCIFGAQISEIRCINTTNILAQMDPTRFNPVGVDGGLPSWAQILIIVSVVVVVSVVVGIAVICWAVPYYREREEMRRRVRERAEVAVGPMDDEALRQARIRRMEAEIIEREQRAIEEQEAEIRRQEEREIFRRRHQEARPNAAIFETNIQIQSADNVIDNNDNDNDNNNNNNNQQELINIAANANGNNNNKDKEGGGGGMELQPSGSFVVAARLELSIFTNRLEMLSTKTESTPPPQLDLAILSFLSENFAFPISREISEMKNVVCPALGIDVLEVYYGSFVFAGRHSDLLICKTVSGRRGNTTTTTITSTHGSNSRGAHAGGGNDDDDDVGNSNNNNNSQQTKQFSIPPTLHCVLGYIPPNNRDLSWIVVDTELLICASQAKNTSAATTNPLGTTSPVSHHQHQHREYQPLAKIFEDNKTQLGNKSYTCSVCFDTIEIHRTPQQTALINGSVCSSTTLDQKKFPSGHFTCATCLSGSVEKMLDEGDTSLQLMPCYHPSCVEARNRFAQSNFTPQQASLLIDSDESGYFIFEDFSSVLKSATLRRWQTVSTEAAMKLGQKQVMSALPKQQRGNDNREGGETAMIREHCQRIRGLLRPRCPHCGLEFMGFTGCVTVKCGVKNIRGEQVAGCSREFCGSCMEPFPCSGGHQHDFMNANTIQSNWKVWRNRRVNAYLSDHFSDWKTNQGTRKMLERVLRTSITDLMEAGIWPLQRPWRDVIPQ